MSKLSFITLAILMTGCSHLPTSIRQAPADNIQLQDVEKTFSQYQHKTARWGGIIIDVINHETETTLQVLAFPLSYYGRPNLKASPLGRFLIKSNEFLDPALYTNNRELTVSGEVIDINNRKVGEKKLNLPVIESQHIHLWPQYRQSQQCADFPFRGSYGYRGYSYRRHYYRPYGYHSYDRHYY